MLPEVLTPLLTSPTTQQKQTHFKSKRKHIRRASSTHRKPPWIRSATCFNRKITERNCRLTESVFNGEWLTGRWLQSRARYWYSHVRLHASSRAATIQWSLEHTGVPLEVQCVCACVCACVCVCVCVTVDSKTSYIFDIVLTSPNTTRADLINMLNRLT